MPRKKLKDVVIRWDRPKLVLQGSERFSSKYIWACEKFNGSMRENSPSVTNSHKRTPKAHLTINNKNNKSEYSVKRYMPATGRASLLIIERTIMRRMENLNFYNVFHKAINKRISVIPYSFNIGGMNGTFCLVTTDVK